MEPMYLSIQQKETGRQIKRLLSEHGYTVKDVQTVMGFENPQAVYKWISGKSLPSLDNFIILSRLLHTSIEDILVIDGDIPHFSLFLNLQFNDFPSYLVYNHSIVRKQLQKQMPTITIRGKPFLQLSSMTENNKIIKF